MAFTTVEKVRSSASHLSSLTNGSIETHMADAQLMMEDLEYPAKYEELIHRNYTIHLAMVRDARRASKESVDGLGSAEYESENPNKKEGLKETPYGREVLRLSGLGKPSFMVI